MSTEEMLSCMQEFTRNISGLLRQSEERIDRTNEMICTLAGATQHVVDSLNRVTNEYSKHIGDLAKCRDQLLLQNANQNEQINKLIKVNENFFSEIHGLHNDIALLHEQVRVVNEARAKDLERTNAARDQEVQHLCGVLEKIASGNKPNVAINQS